MIGIAGRFKEWLYQKRLLKPVELPAFVLSVGNISVGGTGKSAFVMMLSEWAVSKGIPTAVLSRGYKRKTRTIRIVSPHAPLPDAGEVGDEPWMIRNRVPGLGLLVHPDRARMAKRHWSELGEPRLVILDDAFQHWRCARNLDVLMVDATESVEQKTLPFGRLRETVLAARRADLLVISRAHAVAPSELESLEARLRKASEPRHQPTWKRSTAPHLRVLRADYIFSRLRDAATGEAMRADSDSEFLLVAGIAKPDHLRRVVREAGLKAVEEIYYPDHHRWTESNVKQLRAALRRLRNGRLLMTEKDWGRWRDSLGPELPAAVIEVRFDFLGDDKRQLEEFLRWLAKEAGCST